MVGRSDYEDRKQARIDRLYSAAGKANEEHTKRYKAADNIAGRFEFGQPILVGHHSEGKARRDRERMGSNMDKALEASNKAAHYYNKAGAAENNTSISSDDPQAIDKLREKLAKMEAQRDEIKMRNKKAKKEGNKPEPAWVLTNLGGNIRRVKERIAQLEELEKMPAEIIDFDGGEIISDVDDNRVKIVFDERPNEEMIKKLKSWGFKWAPSEQAWQRLRNFNALCAAKRICGIREEAREDAIIADYKE